MEDMARLGVIEQNVRDHEKFTSILYELLRLINLILENPHDGNLRTIRKDVVRHNLQYEGFFDYLKHIGFLQVGDDLTYPKEHSLNNLKVAQASLERKLYICSGSVGHYQPVPKKKSQKLKKIKLTSSKVLDTKNNFLLKIETLFNDVLKYEDENLLEFARKHIPIMTLQVMALNRIREHQRKIKTCEIKGHDLSFDLALLMELVAWFKYKFFSWVDKPNCDSCGGPTEFQTRSLMTTKTETCTLEHYRCVCGGGAKFPRYNDVRVLLSTRRGRCGEWANCFTLLCRALGYDTRYVYDTTDHVWCEVFDYESNCWLHVDPCEGKINTPLIYSHGWGKKLEYVIAVSRDDLQDVTWRYTMDHKQVLKRRRVCEENQLVLAILALRQNRQRQVSDARRRYLAKRALQELVQLMMERKPSDYESEGRLSGSVEWRTGRGEIGNPDGHVFQFSKPGSHSIRYYPSADEYQVVSNNLELQSLKGWALGVFRSTCIFRKVEHDWRMVYLAREEGQSNGTISWKLSVTEDKLTFTSLRVRGNTQVYLDGKIEWTVQFDDADQLPVVFGETELEFSRCFRACVLTARLSGGTAAGGLAWQQAQLFRQSTACNEPALEFRAEVADR